MGDVGLTVRPLSGDADADAVLELAGPWDREWVRADFAEPEHVAWWGLVDPHARLAAVHRAVRWGSAILLCGAYVAPEHRTGPALLRLVRAAHEAAGRLAVSAVVAWSEPGAPHDLGPVARRCGLRPVGPPVHRYLVPAGHGHGAADQHQRADVRGTHAGRPWTANGSRISTDVVVEAAAVTSTVATLDTAVGRSGRSYYEVLASAGDVVGDLELRRRGLVRVNRYPSVLMSTRPDWAVA